jgi:excinuclease ABC subunit C
MTDLRQTVARLPNEPGVYRFLDEGGDVLYVGKAKALRKRVASYFSKTHDTRIAEMIARAHDVEYVVTRSEREALLLEDNFIKEFRPPFNLRLRDDKSYPYIEITLTEEWPRVRFTRERHVPGNLYFGPYSSAKKVRETLELIGRIFPYRKCRGEEPGRRTGTPCLQHFINRSLAPCDGRVGHEEYREVITQVIDFLRGRLGEVARHIERDMREAAAAQEFEKAALLRDRLEAVRHVQERQVVEHEGGGSFDVVGLYQGEPGGNLQVFRVRDGALVDRQTFFVENAAGRDEATVLEEFLLTYYGEGVTIPGQVIVALEDDPAHDLAVLLSERRGAKVEVRRAQRGAKRRLWELAQRNAQLAAEAESERLQHRRESRERALADLRDALGLADLPLRIECYDISNLGEAHPVGSMVVFEGALPKKAHYRKFAVRGVAGQDDFAMMHEVLLRRFGRYSGGSGPRGAGPASGEARGDEAGVGVAAGGGNGGSPHGDGSSRGGEREGAEGRAAGEGVGSELRRLEEPYDESFARLPDLVVIDGGKGQLSAATAALEERGLAVPVIGLAKRREEVFVPGESSPLELPPDEPASLLLQRIRDEAHRFALTFHRQRRGGAVTSASIFDELPQVGPVRRRRILEHFGSPERFVAASREDLEQVPGLPVRVAREIYAQLHKAG